MIFKNKKQRKIPINKTPNHGPCGSCNEIREDLSWRLVIWLLLCLLGSLGSKFHQGKNQGVSTDREDHADTGISPTIIVVVDIEVLQIITSTGILTDLALGSRLRVDQVDGGPHAGHVISQIVLACSIRRVKVGKLFRIAGHRCIPNTKGEHSCHHIVEGIQVVEPEFPEDIELRLRNEGTAE